MTNPATTQSQNQSSVLAQPNIQPIYDLLEHGVRVEGGQSCGPRAPGSPQHGAATGCREMESPRDGLVLMVQQSPEALSQTSEWFF